MESVAQNWFKDLPKTVPADVDAMLAVAKRQRDIVESSKIITPIERADGTIYDAISYAIKRDNRQRRYRIEGHRLWLVVSKEKTVISTSSNGRRNNFGRTFEVSSDGLEKAITNKIAASAEKDWFESMPQSVKPTVEAMQSIAKMQYQIIEDTKTEVVCDNGGRHTKYLVPPQDRRRSYKVAGLSSVWLSVTPTKANIVFGVGQLSGLPVTQESINYAIQHGQKVVEERKNRLRKQHEEKPCRPCTWCGDLFNKNFFRGTSVCFGCGKKKRERIYEAANSQCCLCGAYTQDVGKVSGKCGRCLKEDGRRAAREYARKNQKAKRAARTPEKAAQDRARRRDIDKQRKKEDISYHLQKNLHSNLSCIIKRLSKGQSSRKGYRTMDAVGCTPDFFKQWLESFFGDMPPHRDSGEAMSWDNRHLWHVDHIYPKNICDYQNFDIVRLVWNYRNLRPLWGYANSSKGAKITAEGVEIMLEIAKQLHTN